jgi:hypothetical protein
MNMVAGCSVETSPDYFGSQVKLWNVLSQR